MFSEEKLAILSVPNLKTATRWVNKRRINDANDVCKIRSAALIQQMGNLCRLAATVHKMCLCPKLTSKLTTWQHQTSFLS